MILKSARAVAAGYTERAAFVLAEPPPPTPLLLPPLLAACRHVAEVPSGAGHYLAAYARAGTHVTLVDGNEAMLRAAAQRAASAGLPPRHLRLRHELVEKLRRLEGIDGLVVPNAAVNQLACQSGLADILATLRSLLPAGAPILLQALCLRPGAPADTCGFYDPVLPDGRWHADRLLDPATGARWRRRRQQHSADGRTVAIDFAYRNALGQLLHSSTVQLRLFAVATLATALRTAGFRIRRTLPGAGQRSTEIFAIATGGTP